MKQEDLQHEKKLFVHRVIMGLICVFRFSIAPCSNCNYLVKSLVCSGFVLLHHNEKSGNKWDAFHFGLNIFISLGLQVSQNLSCTLSLKRHRNFLRLPFFCRRVYTWYSNDPDTGCQEKSMKKLKLCFF